MDKGMTRKLTVMLTVALTITSCFTKRADVASESPPQNTITAAPAAEALPQWNYTDKGPSTWSTLSKEWEICGSGKKQSPLDIEKASTVRLPAMRTNFKPAELRIIHHEHEADAINTGHTIQVNYTRGDTLK